MQLKIKQSGAWVFMALLAVVSLAALASRQHDAPPTQSDWQPPEFEIQTASGETFNYPGDLEGPTIVLFWATWCPYCKALMPHLQSIIDEYEGQISVVALNFRDDDDPAAYLARLGFNFKLILHSEEVAQSWGVKGTPGLFLVDETGRVIFSRGAIPYDAFVPDPDEDFSTMKNPQKAARLVPLWAARLRKSIDMLDL